MLSNVRNVQSVYLLVVVETASINREIRYWVMLNEIADEIVDAISRIEAITLTGIRPYRSERCEPRVPATM